jgi:hypothetical protein
MRALWSVLDCLADGAVAVGVLICSDSQSVLNALKENGPSSHFILYLDLYSSWPFVSTKMINGHLQSSM